MKKFGTFVLLLMSLLFLPAISSIQAAANGEVTVGSATARPGQVKTITITIKDLPAAVADFEGTLKFDPWVANVQELAEVNDYTIFASNIDNLKGEVSFVVANYKGNLRKNGAILNIKLLAVGDFVKNNHSDLTLILKSFNDANGNNMIKNITITKGTFEIKNQPPVADFTFSPTKPKVSQAVTFTDSSNDPDGKIASWKWEFGDGTTSTDRNPTHQYSQSGKFTVKLTVTDSDGATNSKSEEIIVGTQPPQAKFTFSPALPNPNQVVQFTDQSTDPDGTVTSWSWDFGDGTPPSTTRNPTHKYSAKGKYTVKLTVTDNSGLTNARSETVLIGLKPPVAKFTFLPASPKAGKMVRFTNQSIDPDGKIVSWSWDFGDGSPTSAAKNPKHTYIKEGTYSVKLTVTDNDDLTATATKEITVGAGKPTVSVHCFPNPASTATTFKYDLPDGTDKATLYVFNITGKLVFHHDVTGTEYTWDLKSDGGADLPNGPYFYYIIARDSQGKWIARSKLGKLVIQRSEK